MMHICQFKTILTIVFFHFLESACNGYDPEASITGLYTGPYFDPLAERNLTAHLGDRAVLPCTVRQLGDKSVSWVRKRDADILTVDRYTFVSDERFEAQYSQPHETWNLVIMYVQERDAGLYECQVSTEPKMSQLFSLRVVVPKVEIVPPSDRFVQAGSTVRINCEIMDVVQQPDYIFWYHRGTRVLEQQDPNIEVDVKDTGPESMVSTLTINSVRKKESGNYTCMPSNLYSASAFLHVLEEEHQAAMQGGVNPAIRIDTQNQLFIYLILIILIIQYGRRINFDYDNSESQNDATERNLGILVPVPPLQTTKCLSNQRRQQEYRIYLLEVILYPLIPEISFYEIDKCNSQTSSKPVDSRNRVKVLLSEKDLFLLLQMTDSSHFESTIQFIRQYSKVSHPSPGSLATLTDTSQIFKFGQISQENKDSTSSIASEFTRPNIFEKSSLNTISSSR